MTQVPLATAYGMVDIKVECLSLGTVLNIDYGSVSIPIVGNTPIVTGSQAIISQQMTLNNGNTDCPAGGTIQLMVQGLDNVNGYPRIVTVENIGTRTVGSTSNWDFSFFINPAKYSVGADYYIAGFCGGIRGDDYISANIEFYKFTVSAGDKYVALGDSYSSGEGAYSYEQSSGTCHRSPNSYAYYLKNRFNIPTMSFVACSGAVTSDLRNASAAGSRQIDKVNSSTEKVTLTIGGNDLGFAKIMDECTNRPGHVGYGCAFSNTDAMNNLASRKSALSGWVDGVEEPGGKNIYSIKSTIELIASRAPNAEIFVAGYPHLFGGSSNNYTVDGNAPGAHTCVVGSIGTYGNINVSFYDAEFINAQADELNGIIQNAVSDVQNSRVKYVPPTYFNGHGLCDVSSPWINGVVMEGIFLQSESFHPTVTGIRYGYGTSFEEVMVGVVD